MNEYIGLEVKISLDKEEKEGKIISIDGNKWTIEIIEESEAERERKRQEINSKFESAHHSRESMPGPKRIRER